MINFGVIGIANFVALVFVLLLFIGARNWNVVVVMIAGNTMYS